MFLKFIQIIQIKDDFLSYLVVQFLNVYYFLIIDWLGNEKGLPQSPDSVNM